MSLSISGIHHVTAIASDPQRNLDFYRGVLGLRLVKRTVNFDDPGSYHLYYGDALGRPGTLLTFFAWPDAARGRPGSGETISVAFSVPEGSLSEWRKRLAGLGVEATAPAARFEEQALSLHDPDGMAIELVAHPGVGEVAHWREGPVREEHAIRGIHSIALLARHPERTSSLLETTLGFGPAGESAGRLRYRGAADSTARVDLLSDPGRPRGSLGAGSIHHVAWRTRDDETQLAWRGLIGEAGIHVTEVQDRIYFHSIYFREPGGVLFEIATDPPGMTVDETPEELGSALRLPPWLEPMRARLERHLPVLDAAGPPAFEREVPSTR